MICFVCVFFLQRGWTTDKQNLNNSTLSARLTLKKCFIDFVLCVWQFLNQVYCVLNYWCVKLVFFLVCFSSYLLSSCGWFLINVIKSCTDHGRLLSTKCNSKLNKLKFLSLFFCCEELLSDLFLSEITCHLLYFYLLYLNEIHIIIKY